MSKQAKYSSILDDFLQPDEKGESRTLGFLHIPLHLKPFWRMYNKLVEDGWFEQTEKDFDVPEVPPSLRLLGKTLVKVVLEEKDIQKKYERFAALSTLIEYLGSGGKIK